MKAPVRDGRVGLEAATTGQINPTRRPNVPALRPTTTCTPSNRTILLTGDRHRYVGVDTPPTSTWRLLGMLLCQPLSAAQLSERLRTLGIHAQPGRRATLTSVAAQFPVAVLADLLHLHPTTTARGQDSPARTRAQPCGNYPGHYAHEWPDALDRTRTRQPPMMKNSSSSGNCAARSVRMPTL